MPANVLSSGQYASGVCTTERSHIEKRYGRYLLFFDMETQSRGGAVGYGIWLFNLTLRVLTLALIVVSLAAAPLALLFLTGRGPITVPAELDPPYRISFLDEQDRSIVVASDFRINEYRNFDSGEEARYLKEPPDVRVDIRIDRADTNSRAVMTGSALGALLLAWVTVWNLRRIVRSAVGGDPFVPKNVARLRRLAMVAFAFPLLDLATTIILDRTLESDPPVDVIGAGVGWWVLAVVGLAVLALAEVFRSGSDLRQLELETV